MASTAEFTVDQIENIDQITLSKMMVQDFSSKTKDKLATSTQASGGLSKFGNYKYNGKLLRILLSTRNFRFGVKRSRPKKSDKDVYSLSIEMDPNGEHNSEDPEMAKLAQIGLKVYELAINRIITNDDGDFNGFKSRAMIDALYKASGFNLTKDLVDMVKPMIYPPFSGGLSTTNKKYYSYIPLISREGEGSYSTIFYVKGPSEDIPVPFHHFIDRNIDGNMLISMDRLSDGAVTTTKAKCYMFIVTNVREGVPKIPAVVSRVRSSMTSEGQENSQKFLETLGIRNSDATAGESLSGGELVLESGSTSVTDSSGMFPVQQFLEQHSTSLSPSSVQDGVSQPLASEKYDESSLPHISSETSSALPQVSAQPKLKLSVKKNIS